MTFVLQVSLMMVLFLDYLNATYDDIFKSFVMGTATVNATRVLCAFLLHFTLIPKVSSAKEMISFAKKNPRAFLG